MLIRIATAQELKSFWSDNNLPTKNYFIKGIEDGTIEFWTIEDENTNQLIGELYIFWDSEDQQEANGKNRAYLCAFNVEPPYQGQGLGSQLMKQVIKRVYEKGFDEVTIGVHEKEDHLIRMYNTWGFSTYIKKKFIDHHNIDEHGRPRKEGPIIIFLKELS